MHVQQVRAWAEEQAVQRVLAPIEAGMSHLEARSGRRASIALPGERSHTMMLGQGCMHEGNIPMLKATPLVLAATRTSISLGVGRSLLPSGSAAATLEARVSKVTAACAACAARMQDLEAAVAQ